MREAADLTGMVLSTMPIGEYDRRLVILTRERGKLTAFASGARRPGNPLMAASQPFAFGKFSLYEGRNAYRLRSAAISNYFSELSLNVEAACYGSYFLELADYFGREGIEGTQMLLLLYQSLRALLRPALPNSLIQLIYELRMMAANGEYLEHPPYACSEAVNYAWEHILHAPMQRLYTFVLKAEAEAELCKNVDELKKRFIDREFHSLKVLQAMGGGQDK